MPAVLLYIILAFLLSLALSIFPSPVIVTQLKLGAILLPLSNNSLPLMEPEGSLPCLKELATRHCREPVNSNVHTTALTQGLSLFAFSHFLCFISVSRGASAATVETAEQLHSLASPFWLRWIQSKVAHCVTSRNYGRVTWFPFYAFSKQDKIHRNATPAYNVSHLNSL